VQELSVDPAITLEPGESLLDTLVSRADADPDRVVLNRRLDGRWVPVTAKEFATEVSALAAGLISAGVQAGDRVGLMSKTRYEWTLSDYAIWTAGGVTVPIYESSSVEQVEWNLTDSGAVLLIVESAEHEALFRAGTAEVATLVRMVVQIDAGGLEELAAAGRDVPAAELEARRATLGIDTLATILYTSGTTGRPKGCELTHGNLLAAGRLANKIVPEVFNQQGSTLLFLPLAHIFARLIQTACLESGSRMGHTADIPHLVDELQSFRPTFLLAVPRVFEKVYNSARQKAESEGKGKVFAMADATAVAWSEALDHGGPGLSLKLRHALFDKLVYGKLRAAMGGQVAHAISGGAPLGSRLGHFFRGVGILVLEGYGLSETTAGAAVNTPSRLRIGTVGPVEPGFSVRIAEDGEVLIKGPTIMRGYWHDEAATAQALADGWFRTGDLGSLDADGFLSITGRKKELIVTANGKNVSPAVLEDRMRAHALISQVMVVGDKQPYVAALVTLDAEALPAWLAAKGKPADTPISALTSDPDVLAEIQGAVDEANKAVSHAESVRAFEVLPVDWTEAGGQLTPSLKLKRSVVMAEFGDQVAALYARNQR
jgi:long-chain acyl-CoA synthetase